MINILKHYILRMEKRIYKNTQTWQWEDSACNKEKGLPCNCLTGLAINYLCYIITNCWDIDLECTLNVSSTDIKYILSKYQGQKLVPVLEADRNSKDYLAKTFVCSKKIAAEEKAYIRIASFKNKKELKSQILNTKPQYGSRITEAPLLCEFFLLFLIAVRTQPIEAESSALLTLVLFLHPNKTLHLIKNFLNDPDISQSIKESLIDFLKQYEKFLESLMESELYPDYEFLFKFSELFTEYTNVHIGDWIEKLIDEQKGNEFLYKILYAAYNRNKDELRRRSSFFKKIKEM